MRCLQCRSSSTFFGQQQCASRRLERDRWPSLAHTTAVKEPFARRYTHNRVAGRRCRSVRTAEQTRMAVYIIAYLKLSSSVTVPNPNTAPWAKQSESKTLSLSFFFFCDRKRSEQRSSSISNEHSKSSSGRLVEIQKWRSYVLNLRQDVRHVREVHRTYDFFGTLLFRASYVRHLRFSQTAPVAWTV